MGRVHNEIVAPEAHREITLLLDLFDLFEVEVVAPVKRRCFGVAECARQTADVSLGVGVQEALHVLVKV